MKTVTEKIDIVLHVGVMVVCVAIWAIVGFPYLTEVVVVGGVVVACGLIWWLTSRLRKKA